MVDSDHATGRHPHCVRSAGDVPVRRAEIAFELIPEVAHIAAGQVKRKLRGRHDPLAQAIAKGIEYRHLQMSLRS
jgi:hypothetical protein